MLDTTKAKDTMRNKIFKLLVSLKASGNIFLQILPIHGENLKNFNYGLTGYLKKSCSVVGYNARNIFNAAKAEEGRKFV